MSGICRGGEDPSTTFPAGSYTFDLLATPCPDLALESKVLTGITQPSSRSLSLSPAKTILSDPSHQGVILVNVI